MTDDPGRKNARADCPKIGPKTSPKPARRAVRVSPMALVVHVPLNTMLADLDETLRTLLKAELEAQGFDGVEVAFDAPSRDWSSQLSQPTVSMFLYDVREAADKRPVDWEEGVSPNGRRSMQRPPMIVEATYAVTAWTQDVQDEHRLLSQVLQIFFAYPQLPADALEGRLRELAERFPLSGTIAQPKAEGKADFWSAVGGQYKPSLDYVVHMACESGTAYERGPEVRTSSLRMGIADGPARTIEEMHRVGGKVADGEGAPVRDVWVTVPELGIWASSNAQGRFHFDRVPAGTYAVVARTITGDEIKGELKVPGALDLTTGSAPKKKGK